MSKTIIRILSVFIISLSVLIIPVSAEEDNKIVPESEISERALIQKPKRVRTVVPLIYTGPTYSYTIEYCYVNETSTFLYTTTEVLTNGPEAYIYDTVYHYSNEFVYSEEPVFLPE